MSVMTLLDGNGDVTATVVGMVNAPSEWLSLCVVIQAVFVLDEEEEDSDDTERVRRFPLLVSRINFRNDLGGETGRR